jgi:tetratricopeptide (TPR) repeat protein
MSEPLVPGSLEQEIRDLRAVLFSDRDPDGRGFAPLADALRRAGDLGRALEMVEAGVQRLPDYATGHVVAGWVYRTLAKADEAEHSFRRVLELDEENISALKGLGFLLAERGQGAEALGLFQRLDDLDPGDPEVRARLVELGGSDGSAPGTDPTEAAVGIPPEPGGMGLVVDIETLAPGGPGAPSADSVVADPEGWVVDIATLAPDESAVIDIEDLAPDVEVGVGADGQEGEGTAGKPLVESVEASDAKPSHWGGDLESGDADAEGGPSTRTMAELLVRQGHLDRAIRIYRRLSDEKPDDESLRTRLAEIEGLAGTRSSGAAGETVDDSVTDYLAGLLAWRPASRFGGEKEDRES